MSGKAVLENVRRYRAIASLCRQTAAFRPLQKWSLLEQAEEWERLAMRDLESYFDPAIALPTIDSGKSRRMLTRDGGCGSVSLVY